MARCSQPEVGLLFWRSKEDEDLVKAIADSCAFNPPDSDLNQTSGSISLSDLEGEGDLSQTNNVTSNGDLDSVTPTSSENISMCHLPDANVRKNIKVSLILVYFEFNQIEFNIRNLDNGCISS